MPKTGPAHFLVCWAFLATVASGEGGRHLFRSHLTRLFPEKGVDLLGDFEPIIAEIIHDPEAVPRIMRSADPYAAAEMDAVPVSLSANGTKNDVPGCLLAPVELGQIEIERRHC